MAAFQEVYPLTFSTYFLFLPPELRVRAKQNEIQRRAFVVVVVMMMIMIIILIINLPQRKVIS
jgi:hypothetical protein